MKEPRTLSSRAVENRTGWTFVLPALAIYLFYFLAPIPLSAYYSLFQWSGVSALDDFIGFSNWNRLVRDAVFWVSVRNNVLLVVLSVVIQLPLGLLLAVYVSSKLKGTRTLKFVFFLPMTMSAVAIGLTWRYVFDANFGLLNGLLEAIGLPELARSWLGNPRYALPAVVAVVCWQFIPYYMVIFAAALAGIPRDLIDSAAIDGAAPVQTFFRIKLPLLGNTVRMAIILSVTGSLKYFALVFVMTGGGPYHASELMATYMYKQAFSNFRMGYGSTVAVFMFLLSFVVTVLILRIRRKDEAT
ncbi:MAG: carbohydrate ABC transporter permease [Spirochaetaceae bacterium]